MGVLVTVLLLVTGAILLVTDGTSGGTGGAPSGARSVDGVLRSVSEAELVLQPTDGTAEQRFPLTPADVRRLDLFHLQLHARDQLPSRVFYVEKDGKRSVVRVDDL